MLRRGEVGSTQRILISLSFKKLLIEAGVRRQWEDSLKVTPTHELLIEVHEHFKFVLREGLKARHSVLLS